MAKKLDLQAYQENILARLKALEQSHGTETASRLGVQVGEDFWLLSLRDVGEVLAMPDIHPIPLTRSWFMGMANVRGNLYAVTDLSAFLGGRPVRLSLESRLLLAGSRFGVNAAFLIDRLLGLKSIAEMTPAHNKEHTSDWALQQYTDASGQVWRELAMATLLNSATFMQVAA
jgi:twitching motility protein PilI